MASFCLSHCVTPVTRRFNCHFTRDREGGGERGGGGADRPHPSSFLEAWWMNKLQHRALSWIPPSCNQTNISFTAHWGHQHLQPEPSVPGMEAEEQQLRNLRDFLLVYNKMTELCFSRCARNMNYHSVTMDEEKCLDSCASKFIRSNHRMMSAYVGLMPGVVQRRMAELEAQSKELPDSTQAEPVPHTDSPAGPIANIDGGSQADQLHHVPETGQAPGQ
uniref:Tim10-like domain-containing protein n=1 Tax=Leptobrachium leishanense TaxID=445787 RepID=A0A8C5R9X0_9ANUR